MSEPSSLFCRVRLSRSAFDRFLTSQILPPSAFEDWATWLSDAEMYERNKFLHSLSSMCPPRAATVSVFLNEWLSRPEAFARSAYDANEQTWRFGIIEFAQDYDTLVRETAVLRGITRYKDLPGTDAAVVVPYLFGPAGLSTAMLFDQGTSRLLKEMPPGTVDEAYSFFRATLERAGFGSATL